MCRRKPCRLWLVSLGALLWGCSASSLPNSCPVDLVATFSQNLVVKWSNESSAQLSKVALECIPFDMPRDGQRVQDATSRTYVIAVTTVVESDIKKEVPRSYPPGTTLAQKIADWDPNYGDAPIVFEAISANGVVLGNAREIFSGPEGIKSASNVTAKIALSDEEVRRVRSVLVRWDR